MNKLLRILVICAAAAACSNKNEPKAAPQVTQRIQAQLEKSDSTSTVSLATGDTLHVSTATLDFYRRRRYRPAWVDGDHATEPGKSILKVLSQTEADGLNPVRYQYDVVQRLAGALGRNRSNQHAQDEQDADLDVLLTEAFTRYAHDLSQGTLDPDSAGLKWRIPRGSIPKENLLRALQRGASAEDVIARVRPAIPQYGRLSRVLQRLDSIKASGGWQPITAGKAEKGDSSALIAALRTRLERSEDPRESAYAHSGAERPMFYDHELFLAVQHFQQRNNIDADGDLGDKTLRELNHSVDDRIEEVKLNMDRWRWLPHDLGKMYALVNIAGYEVSIVENNHQIMGMNVVVGKQGWETPIFADTMEDMVVNPSWHVPPSIAAEEMGNVSDEYLASHHFVRSSDGGYTQLPGPDNALGQYKFEFPNKDNIYLHDTPADALFSRTDRAFSHGCIRLERPRDLAYLLGEKLAGKTPEQIDALSATGEEHTIRFKKKLPIYILYFTAWVDEDGSVVYNHDVYGHDEAIQPQTSKFEQRAT